MRAQIVEMAAILLIFCASIGAAQRPAQQPVPPAFKSGVQILEVDARVFDRDGRFIADLTMDEFEILENGVPQQIQTMFLVGGPMGPVGTPGTAAAVPRAPQTWIFIFDHRHLMPNGFSRARNALDSFMAERFRSADLAGIVMNDRMVNDRISSVPAEYLAALRKVQAPGDATWRAADRAEAATAGGEGEAGAAIREALGYQTAREQRRAARDSAEMLDALAKGLAPMPGPKTIVLFSDGFGLPELEGTLRTVVGRMNRAGARLYAVDTRGLAGAPGDMLNSLSVDTGGLVLFNENNIARALDTIAADTNTYYVLGYQPANQKYDGKYRQIEVRVNRPNVEVRARKGYLALPPAKMLIPKPIR